MRKGNGGKGPGWRSEKLIVMVHFWGYIAGSNWSFWNENEEKVLWLSTTNHIAGFYFLFLQISIAFIYSWYGFSINIDCCYVVLAEFWDLGLKKLILEIDSIKVIKVIKVIWANENEQFFLVVEHTIKDLLKRSWIICIKHVFREGHNTGEELTKIQFGFNGDSLP